MEKYRLLRSARSDFILGVRDISKEPYNIGGLLNILKEGEPHPAGMPGLRSKGGTLFIRSPHSYSELF